MLCQLCLADYMKGKTAIPPAEATHIVTGPQVLDGIFPVCEDHANNSEQNDPGYVCLRIDSPEGQALLNKCTRGQTP
jgi:hypothetical protein